MLPDIIYSLLNDSNDERKVLSALEKHRYISSEMDSVILSLECLIDAEDELSSVRFKEECDEFIGSLQKGMSHFNHESYFYKRLSKEIREFENIKKGLSSKNTWQYQKFVATAPYCKRCNTQMEPLMGKYTHCWQCTVCKMKKKMTEQEKLILDKQS